MMRSKSFQENHAAIPSGQNHSSVEPSSLETELGNPENFLDKDKDEINRAKIPPAFTATMNWKKIKILELLQYCLETSHEVAWDELWRRLEPAIKRSIRKKLSTWTKPRPEQVEELAQDTWHKLIKNDFKALKNRFPADGALFQFVITTAVRVAQDYFRSNEWKVSSNAQSLDDQDKPIDLPAPPPPDVNKVVRDKVDKVLFEEFGSEPTFKRDLAIFWYFNRQGFSARQIAKLCSLPAKDVPYILYRMVKVLKRRLGGNQ